MHYRTLGRTGLKVSLLSLGTGGTRSMGQTQGLTQQDQDMLVRRSLDLGINLFDIYDHSYHQFAPMREILRPVR